MNGNRQSKPVALALRAFPWVAGLAVACAMVPAAKGEGVTSWGWRASLAHAGLDGVRAQSTSTTPTATIVTSLTQAAPENVTEPAATTRLLKDLTLRRSIDPSRFDKNHTVLGPLLGEAAQLTANCSNVSTFNDLLPDNPFYNYLRWRRSLNPIAFDASTPRLGTLLAEDQRVRKLIASCMTQAQNLTPPSTNTGTPHGATTGGGGTGGTLAPQFPAVPEPTSTALFLIGAGVLIAGRIRARRSLSKSA